MNGVFELLKRRVDGWMDIYIDRWLIVRQYVRVPILVLSKIRQSHGK